MFGRSKGSGSAGVSEIGMKESQTISEAEAANKLMRLAKAIAKHDRLCLAEDAPEISGEKYDPLVRRDRLLEGV